jgi:galactokinase
MQRQPIVWRRPFFLSLGPVSIFHNCLRMPDPASTIFQQQFGHAPTVVGYAPGRLEFIGNHVDYNGGLVIGATIDRGVQAAAGRRSDRRIRVFSPAYGTAVETDLDGLEPLSGSAAWANYPLGVAWSLQKNGGPFPVGFDLAISGDLPAGAGLSSSAALELAAGVALRELFGLKIEPVNLARWCRQAENEFVGMPCGILDQGVSMFGQAGRLVLIDCQAETFSTVPVPESARFWVFNTGAKHALLDSLYAARRRECEAALGVLKRHHPHATLLAEISSAEVERYHTELTPDQFKRALHVTREIERVRGTVAALEKGDLAAVGRLLRASHQSSRELFENSCPELDFLVDHLVKLPGVYGARLTGGGFGGAVMALTTPEFTAAVAQPVTTAYTKQFGHEPVVFSARTGPGARVMQ